MARRLLICSVMRFVAVVIAVFATGCIIPDATPPLKGEIGMSSRVGHEDEPNARSLHAAVGAHLASATQTPHQLFDVGMGWIVEKTADDSSHGLYLDGAFF